MRQCAGCGRRYEETQTACTSCFSRSWVYATETDEDAPLPANPNPCSTCGYYTAAGVPHCPHCKAQLRPRLLEWLCYLGIAAGPAGFLYLIYVLINPPHNFWALGGLPVCAAVAPVCLGLLRGEYRALRGLWLLIIGTPLWLLVLVIPAEIISRMSRSDDYTAREAVSSLATSLLFAVVGAVLLGIIFRLPRFQDYCALGKPKEFYRTKEVFMEQSHASKAQRSGSNITRNL